MKNRGFTLIELLAVLVILSIIALIAVPIIQNMIRDSRKNATLRSAEFYIDAINETIASRQASIDFDLDDGTYNINSDGNLCLDDECSDIFEVEVENTRPTSGSVDIENNRVVSVSSLYFPKYKYNISTVDGNLTASKENISFKTYKNGEVVYFDVYEGKVCSNYHKDNSIKGYNGTSSTKTTDNQNSCLKFYAFLDDGGSSLNLMLDHNTSSSSITSTDSNGNGPELAVKNLSNDTKEWSGTITPKSYYYSSSAGNHLKSDNSSVSYDEINYKVDYSGLKARLITANEVAKIAGITTFDETKNDGTIVGDESGVLEINTDAKVSLNSATFVTSQVQNSWLIGDYSTSSAVHDTYGSFWAVSEYGNLSIATWKSYGTNTYTYGIRPVIEINKNKI